MSGTMRSARAERRGARAGRNFALAIATATGAFASACAERDEAWDQPTGMLVAAYGLDGSLALVDEPFDRALVFAADADQVLAPSTIDVGRGFVAGATTPDHTRLLVLSRGEMPRRTADDPGPRLTVIGGGTDPHALARFDLDEALGGIAVDPESAYAVLYAGGADAGSFVQNPNELVLVDLARGPGADNPIPLTLRSFGGRPQGFTFTPSLALPGGPRRLLVVHTDRDVSLLDLASPTTPEITVKLTSGAEPVVPAGVAVSDGDPDRDDDARIAVRAAGDANVILVDLLPVPPEDRAATPQTFRAVPNIVFAGGVPADLAFVRTDGGLRLAAVVPGREALVLIDPTTGNASEVALGAAFGRISVVTDVVGQGEDGSDVALLWSSSTPEVAFVALGSTVGKPYKAVDRLALEHPVAEVIDVPAAPRTKVLASPSGDRFVVLDLVTRTASPLVASSSGTRLRPAHDGTRAWMLSQGTSAIAQLDLATLHPRNVHLSHLVLDAFEIARRDGGRALVAVHPVGAVALTVLDANDPALATSREYVGVLLGGEFEGEPGGEP